MNLFNAPNALSGLSSAQSFLSPGCCALVSASSAEALRVFLRAGLDIPLPMRIVPWVFWALSLSPVSVFCSLLLRLLRVIAGVSATLLRLCGLRRAETQTSDPKAEAHSSMFEDLSNGRNTEVGALLILLSFFYL